MFVIDTVGVCLDILQLFTVQDMLYDATHGDVSSTKNISTEGAIILVTSIWNCNLDRSEDSMYTFHVVLHKLMVFTKVLLVYVCHRVQSQMDF